jgi:ABC-type sugar transport system substrate-binding protein
MSGPATRRTTPRVLAAAVAAAFALTACADDGWTTAGPAADDAAVAAAVAEAEQLLAAARQPLRFTPPGPAFDATGAAGKDVWFVNANESAPILLQWRTTVQRELEALGVRVTLFDGKEDPNAWARGVQQAVAARADAIVLQAIPSDLVARPVAEAAAAGIPVITAIGASPAVPGASRTPGVTADVTFDYRVPGRLLAQWFVADSRGSGKAVIFSFKGSPSSDTEVEAMQAEIARLCPRCVARVEDAPVTTWGDGTLQALTETLLRAHPDVTHILPAFDGMVLGVEPGVVAARRQDGVRIASFNAEVPLMQAMRDGSALKMDVGGPNDWFAASVADTVLRTLAGQPAVADHGIGFRVFDHESVQGMDVDQEVSSAWYGVDFLAEYRGLWRSAP